MTSRANVPNEVSLAGLENRAGCERRNDGLHAECHLMGMFADTLCELEMVAVGKRMIAPRAACAPRSTTVRPHC